MVIEIIDLSNQSAIEQSDQNEFFTLTVLNCFAKRDANVCFLHQAFRNLSKSTLFINRHNPKIKR